MTETGLKRFDLVIFDWAGTMVDFGCQAPIVALREAFARRGVQIEEQVLRGDMGKAKADHVRALLATPSVVRDWTAIVGAPPTEADVPALMEDLAPLMREAAAAASDLIPGAAETVAAVRAAGLKIASSTGYTREMMEPVLARAKAQGYAPDHVVCADETPQGRPSPLMIYKACAELGVWPLSRVVKVDDAEAGIAEGRAAGCFTVGISASGNGVGLSQAALAALGSDEREALLATAAEKLMGAGADVVIESVRDLLPKLREGQTSVSRPRYDEGPSAIAR